MHVILAVDDVERAVAFYERVLQWPRNPLIDYSNYVELLDPAGGTLGLYERSGFAAASGAEPAPAPERETATELYVRVDDVAPLLERLHEVGARPLKELEPKVWGDDAAYFADPDGNVLAVAQYTRVPAPTA